VDTDDLRPSPENDLLYRPARGDAADLQAMAADMEANGVREPLVITRDNYIVSGHRRHKAATMAGLGMVPCRVLPLTRSGMSRDDYVRLLAQHNLGQRVKSFDETAREQIVLADPDESYQQLVEFRREKAQTKAEPFQIDPYKRRPEITAAKHPFLDAINAVLEAKRQFWPISQRAIHYALLNDPPLKHASKPHSAYRNDRESAKALSDLLTRARNVGLVPWQAVQDETRPLVTWNNCYPGVGDFLADQMGGFLKNYFRDLQRSQPNHIEIVSEKNTMLNVIRPVAEHYCINYFSEHGQCSWPPRKELAERFRRSGKEKLVLLILADFDPDGVAIMRAFARTMRDDHAIWNVEPHWVCLNPEQVRRLHLPTALDANPESMNIEKFVREFGTDAYELEAVEPADVQSILHEAINAVMDLDAFKAEQEAEKQDAARLATLRRVIKQKMVDSLAGVGIESNSDKS
jgi:hypothetical protein